MSGNLLIQDRPSVPIHQPVPSLQPATQITQEVRNRNLLNTMFKFKKDAPLRQFIHDITKVQKNYYSLAEILTILKDVISSEKMFDERNPSVIICSKPLEAALNQRALHVTEVRDLVINQLERLADQSLRDNLPSQRINSSQPRSQLARGPPQTAPPTAVRTASITTNVQTNKDTKFRLKPLFLEVVRTVDEVNPKQTVFTYEEITSILSKYILSKKNVIFDTRNIKLALVENDPLGKAFGVTAFHRCQVNALLRTQLIPVHPDCPLDQLSTTTNSAPNLSVTSTERQVPVVSAPASSSSSPSLPPFPALEKAASLPASFSNRRKRTSSTEKSEEETSRQQKQQRRADQCSVIIRRSEESEESETETIYSEQGYETIKAEEENDEAASSGSDMDTTREVFEVEYDIDSGEEEERPPQAHGQGQDFSSAENSDSSADEDYRATNPVASKVVESVYWADSEEEKEEKGEVAMKSGKEKVKCFSCKTPNQPLITHCTRCWDSRKQWAPERPRRKRKGDKKKKQQTKTPPVVVALGMDDTDGSSAIEGETDRPRSDTMSSQDSGIGSQEFEMLELTETEVASEGRPVSLDLTKLSRSISLDTTRSSSSSTCGSSTMDTSELSELGSIPDLKQVAKVQEMCMFCEMRPRNAIFIHGKLGHQVCCYPCAKKNWKTSPNCPICKRRVEKIIKAIQA